MASLGKQGRYRVAHREFQIRHLRYQGNDVRGKIVGVERGLRRLGEVSTVVAGGGPLAIATGVGAGVAGKEAIKACGKVISENKDKLKDLCKSGLLAGSLVGTDREGNKGQWKKLQEDPVSRVYLTRHRSNEYK